MRATPYLIMLIVAGVSGSWLFAAETPPAPTPAPAQTAEQPASDEIAKSDAEADAGDAKADEENNDPTAATDEDPTQKSAADKAGAGKDSTTKASPQRFIPSEQVRPDFDVSFPVDI